MGLYVYSLDYLLFPTTFAASESKGLIWILKNLKGIPGRKPGTSTKVMMGMLKASQKRTKRAPFTEELMSKQPDKKKDISILFLQTFPPSIFDVLLTWSHFGLITHNAHSAPVHPGKAHDDVFGVTGHDLEKVPFVHYLSTGSTFSPLLAPPGRTWKCVCLCTYCMDDLQHVVGFCWLKRDNGVQRLHQSITKKQPTKSQDLVWENKTKKYS